MEPIRWLGSEMHRQGARLQKGEVECILMPDLPLPPLPIALPNVALTIMPFPCHRLFHVALAGLLLAICWCSLSIAAPASSPTTIEPGTANATLTASAKKRANSVGPPYNSKGQGCCTGGYRDPNKCWNANRVYSTCNGARAEGQEENEFGIPLPSHGPHRLAPT
ncbi:hypothetical protein BDZ90DRAFT_184699 [Jaminaea rosea]|uniref:Uncharacterized protein n=1 Tax=Jaminaea rosea TaxID=1569628 RepID=A0A316UP37_9BASI|nr:hypothetical protein BDZ90DRAFT_184699 [Jaminaea rosea]PWN27062.1 hypothetical protein BDZ90DRAFT_184699 [Jaminaea rosea]